MGPLSGQLIHYFLIAVLDAALLSWLAIAWYRRRMRALMRASSLASGEAIPPPPERRRPAAALAGAALPTSASYSSILAARPHRALQGGTSVPPTRVNDVFD